MRTLTSYEPFRGLNSLQHQVNRLLGESIHPGQSDSATWAPAVDIYEAESELVIKADLPGLQESDIDVRVENNTLTIRGERKFEKDVSEEKYLRVERVYGAFTRSFSLSPSLNTEAVEATYRNGTLTVKLPKREESKPKQIKVNVNTAGTESNAK